MKEYLNPRALQERQNLIFPIEPTPEMRLKNWISQNYDSHYKPVETNLVTINNIKVRSKSELVIGDKLVTRKKAFRYEMKLVLEGEVLYPDFVIYDPVKDKIYIWEHFGMMSDPVYANDAIRKIELYERNGFTRDNNLIVTFESSERPLNTRWVDDLIDRYLGGKD